MRKFIWVCLFMVLTAPTVGCVLPQYAANPARRTRQLIFESENLRHIGNIWERFWGLDMPDVATPYRTHGGVI